MTSSQVSLASRRLLIQMSGVPGSGKSTLAKALCRSLEATVIDHDDIRSRHLGSNIGKEDFQTAAQLSYDEQWVQTEEAMSRHVHVIVDSTCNSESIIQRGRELAERHGYKYCFVQIEVGDIDVLDQRLRARAPKTSQRTSVDNPPACLEGQDGFGVEESRAQFRTWMELRFAPETDTIRLDGLQDAQTIHKAALERLRNEFKDDA